MPQLLFETVSTHGFNSWLTNHEAVGVWLTGIATAVLAIGVLFAWGAIRDGRITRHAQIIADFSRRWDGREIHRSAALGKDFGPQGLVELTNKLYGPNAARPPDRQNLTDWYRVLIWPNLLETIGVLVHARALPREWVYRMWGGPIIDAWNDDWKPAVVVHRKQKRDDNIFATSSG